MSENDPTKDGSSTAVRFDAQEYMGISEEDMVDYETAEEFLLHFSRAGKLSLVAKLLNLRDAKEIPLNIDCKGKNCQYFVLVYFSHLFFYSFVYQAKVRQTLAGLHFTLPPTLVTKKLLTCC